MSKITKLLRAALRAANASQSNWKVGCAAYRNGRIIGTGTNSTRTSPATTNRSRKTHAEFDLTTTEVSDATVLVLRISGGGLACARPCNDCYPLLKDARWIYYSDTGGVIREYYSGRVIGTVKLEAKLGEFNAV